MSDYLVIFHSVNGWWEDEHYWYNTEPEAFAHMMLFLNDDSGLYTHITVEKFSEGTILHEMKFKNELVNTNS